MKRLPRYAVLASLFPFGVFPLPSGKGWVASPSKHLATSPGTGEVAAKPTEGCGWPYRGCLFGFIDYEHPCRQLLLIQSNDNYAMGSIRKLEDRHLLIGNAERYLVQCHCMSQS